MSKAAHDKVCHNVDDNVDNVVDDKVVDNKFCSQSSYRGQRACVLGAGLSGVAAARLLAAQGGNVTLIDAAPAERLEQARDALRGCGGVSLRGGVVDLPGEPFTLCVASPSIPPNHPWVRDCAARGIRVVGELELGHAFWGGRILAVTGSKGKSSVVKLCAGALTAAGHSAVPAGNYGLPLSACVLDCPDIAWAVVEVSSFQLEQVTYFRPNVAILLNLQPDHLDRHGTMEIYTQLKYRLFARQGPGDTALLPEDLSASEPLLPSGVALRTFGGGPGADWRYAPGRIDHTENGATFSIAMEGTWFDNPVLGPAAAAAAGALHACGLTATQIAAGLSTFRSLPHRLQHVAQSGGVFYIDDSKATSLTALGAALKMVAQPVRLIAGGRLKEPVTDAIKELLTSRVKKVYLIGESAKTLQEAWHAAVPCVVCGDMATAVDCASREASPGEAVMLSPGCASFDQFDGYEQRGECFSSLVRSLEAASETMTKGRGAKGNEYHA